MYTFTKTRTVQSTTLSGVEIVYRKMTEDRRAELQRSLAGPQAEIRDLLAKMNRLKKDGEDGEPALLGLNDELQAVITQKLNPAKVKWAVAAVRGLCIGDENEPASLENYGAWPSDLVKEILVAIEDATVLAEVEAKNSVSPTTSGAGTGGATNSTTATAA